jgi:hypothetical protein
MVDLPGTRRQRLGVAVACVVAAAALVVGLATQTHPPKLPAEPQHVTVPKVVGDLPGKAAQELRAHHLGKDVTALADKPCAGLPSAREPIVDQAPLPGTRVGRDDKVRVQIGCPAVAPACKQYQLAIKTYPEAPIYTQTGGQPEIIIDLTHIAGPPCHVVSTLYLELLRGDGTLATEVAGNPTTYPLDAMSGVGETLTATWWLHGGVHPTTQLTVNAHMGSWSTTGHVHTPLSDKPSLPELSLGGPGDRPLTMGTGSEDYRAAVVTTHAYGRSLP